MPLHRTLAFGFAGFLARCRRRVQRLVERPDRASDLGLNATITLLVMAVIGGLVRIEGAWLGAFAFTIIENRVRDGEFLDLLVPVPGLGGSFNTIVGLIFLAIVVVSPDGLMGIWERLWSVGRSRGPTRPSPAPAAGAASAQER